MKAILKMLDRFIAGMGNLCVLLFFLMVLTVCINVWVRYLVTDLIKAYGLYDWWQAHMDWLGGTGMVELAWHFNAAMFMVGIGYALRHNAHVRVDVFFEHFSLQQKALVNMLGIVFLLLPFAAVVCYWGVDFFWTSFMDEESKGDPGSLPRLWPIKLFIPYSFVFLLICAAAVFIEQWLVWRSREDICQ